MSICIFGDSIAYGAMDTEKGGWAERLKMLSDNDVYNLGVSGDTTVDLLKRFKVECEAREPGKIVFAIGINDSQYLGDKSHYRVPAEEFKENLLALIQQALVFTQDIVFVGLTKVDESKVRPIPWKADVFYDNESILQYNAIIESVAKKAGLRFVPIFDLLDNQDLPDGLHPNASGHEKIFKRVKDVIV